MKDLQTLITEGTYREVDNVAPERPPLGACACGEEASRLRTLVVQGKEESCLIHCEKCGYRYCTFIAGGLQRFCLLWNKRQRQRKAKGEV